MQQQINLVTQHAIHNLLISAEELAERLYTNKALKAKRGYNPKATCEDFEITVKQDIAKLREVLGVVAVVTEPHPAPEPAKPIALMPLPALDGIAVELPAELTVDEKIEQLSNDVENLGRRVLMLESK